MANTQFLEARTRLVFHSLPGPRDTPRPWVAMLVPPTIGQIFVAVIRALVPDLKRFYDPRYNVWFIWPTYWPGVNEALSMSGFNVIQGDMRVCPHLRGVSSDDAYRVDPETGEDDRTDATRYAFNVKPPTPPQGPPADWFQRKYVNDDDYRILFLQPTAPLHIAKLVFRELAKTLHPDRQGGDTSKFQVIEAAFRRIEKSA